MSSKKRKLQLSLNNWILAIHTKFKCEASHLILLKDTSKQKSLKFIPASFIKVSSLLSYEAKINILRMSVAEGET